MGLFDFIEQNHGIGTTTNTLGELTAFFKTDVSRRGANQPADVVLLHVLGHVDLNQSFFVAEHEFGQRLGQQRLTDSGRASKQEAAGRTLGVLQTTAAATHGFRHLLDRLVLADHAVMHLLFHLQQSDSVLAGQTRQRNSCHLGDDFRDHFGIDDAFVFLTLLTPLLRELFLLLFQLVRLVTQCGGLFKVLIRDRFFLLLIQSLGFFFEFLEVRWTHHGLQSDAGSRFINDINGLVRETATGDVS